MAKIKVSDYIADFLARKNIKDLFMISGGGIIHLVESIGSNKALNYFCNYNEQAAAYCAEGYARFKNGVAVCMVTTGPGSTNALSGVASAWVDSVPVVVISGQVKRELIADYSRLRQVGEQEIDIIDMVKPIAKYSAMVDRPGMIRYELERAFYAAEAGRPGPAWINVPLDVQGSFVDAWKLRPFMPKGGPTTGYKSCLKNRTAEAVSMLKKAKRPILICGYGIRIAGAQNLLGQILEKIRMPVLLSFNGMDLIPDNHPLLIGRPGIIGQRRANFAIQNSDCILSVGSRLNIKMVGYNYRAFAPRARKIVVDIDKAELEKPTVRPDLGICADAGDFLREFLDRIAEDGFTAPRNWLDICEGWKRLYPSIDRTFLKDKRHVNTYVFYDTLANLLDKEDTVVSGNGLAALCLYQAFRVKKGQRAFTNNGYGAMGWDLPAAIGACIANDRKKTVCVTGDGSIQMNIQELQLVRHHNLPIKVFIFNNGGYASIRLTQDAFFGGHYIASDADSGVSNPDFRKIAGAYGLDYERILTNVDLKDKIKKVLSVDGPVLCELNVSYRQGVVPKVSSFKKRDGSFQSRPLEDMAPFLPREELKRNMRLSAGR